MWTETKYVTNPAVELASPDSYRWSRETWATLWNCLLFGDKLVVIVQSGQLSMMSTVHVYKGASPATSVISKASSAIGRRTELRPNTKKSSCRMPPTLLKENYSESFTGIRPRPNKTQYRLNFAAFFYRHRCCCRNPQLLYALLHCWMSSTISYLYEHRTP